MSGDKWTSDDDRARAVLDLRVAMRKYLGVNCEGLTDAEVLLVMKNRAEVFSRAMKPIVDRLQAAGLIDVQDAP